MSRIKKLMARIRQNPRAVRYADLDKIMLRHGFEADHDGGSHVVYRKGDK